MLGPPTSPGGRRSRGVTFESMAGEQLRVTEGKERGKLLSVDADLLIGREAPEDDGRARRRSRDSHAATRAYRAGPTVSSTIEDLGSANGTFVNDERIDAPPDASRSVTSVTRVGQDGPRGDRQLRRQARPVAAPRPETPAAEPRPILNAGARSRSWWSPPGAAAWGRQLALGRRARHRTRGERRGKLSDDSRALPPARPRRPRRRRRADDRGSRVGERDIPERRARSRPQVLKVGDSVRVGSTTLQLTDVGRVTRGPGSSRRPAPAAAARPPARPRAPAAARAPRRGGS